tara:strand:+ start:2613 stop:3425 length:813 start_codon:yes stop_codon:yes gene_type:complete
MPPLDPQSQQVLNQRSQQPEQPPAPPVQGNQFPGIIRGAPDASADIARGRLNISQSAEARGARGEAREVEQDAQEQAQQAERARQADSEARGKLIRFIGRASEIGVDANDNGGWFETGTTGAFMRNFVPGTTAADDLVANTNTLRANLAFDALQAMRDASQTGGALGQVSEIELQLLESATANVNPEGQTHENFMRNLDIVRQAYLGKLALVDPGQAERLGYSAEASEAAWEALTLEYGEQFGVGARQQASPSQQQPADIADIMSRYGVQ